MYNLSDVHHWEGNRVLEERRKERRWKEMESSKDREESRGSSNIYLSGHGHTVSDS